MASHQNVAIVFGGGINGLGVIRNLGRNGVTVYCVVDKVDEAIYSKYCKKRFVVPNIQNNTQVLKSFLTKLDSTLSDYAVLYSTTDLFSLGLSRLKDEIQGNYHVLLPAPEIVETLVNKKLFYRSLSDLGVVCPITYFPDSIESAKKMSKVMRYPVFIKPYVSQVFTKKFSRKGFIANLPEELIHHFNLAVRNKIDVMLQEVVPGPAGNIIGVPGYFSNGQYSPIFFAYHRIRAWPPVFGNTTLMESIPISYVVQLTEIVKSYLEAIKYYGLMEAEFKMDPRDGIFKLLEINARTWWQNSLPTKCGLNLVLIAYLIALGKKIRFEDSYQVGKKWINLPTDILSLIGTGDTGLKKWLVSLNGIRDWSYFSASDFLPWIAGYIFNALAFLKTSRNNMNS